MESINRDNYHVDAHHNADTPDTPLTEIQLAKRKRRSRLGRILLGIGVVLMAISFGINLFIPLPFQTMMTSMLVLTSAGALFILAGLACVLGF